MFHPLYCPYVVIFQGFLRFLWFRGQQFMVHGSVLQLNFWMFLNGNYFTRDHILGSEQVAPFLSTSSRHQGLNCISNFLFACLSFCREQNRIEVFTGLLLFKRQQPFVILMPASLWIVNCTSYFLLDFLAWSLELLPLNNLDWFSQHISSHLRFMLSSFK